MDKDIVELAADSLIALAAMGDREGKLYLRAARANLAGDMPVFLMLISRLALAPAESRPEERLTACLAVVGAISCQLELALTEVA